MDYLVTVAVVVDTPSEQKAMDYVDRKLRGSYTKDIKIINVEYKDYND
ncbi:MAG: hypothetical protein ACRD8Z_23925 [Nitrososphaeraceae archaeon]